MEKKKTRVTDRIDGVINTLKTKPFLMYPVTPDEAYPPSNGVDVAQRFNSGKLNYSLLDLKSLEACVRVLEFGAKKYSRDNWKKGMPRHQIIDSMMRHLAALIDGEENDPESGLSHIGHIQCNALFLGNKNNTE